jgi:hypothetical protein
MTERKGKAELIDVKEVLVHGPGFFIFGAAAAAARMDPPDQSAVITEGRRCRRAAVPAPIFRYRIYSIAGT